MDIFEVYTLKEIINNLKSDANFIERVIAESRNRIQKLKKEKYWNHVDYNFRLYINEYLRIFSGFEDELSELINEIKIQIKDYHIQRIKFISNTSHNINVQIGDYWNNKYEFKDYNNNLFFEVDFLYADIRNCAVRITLIDNFIKSLNSFKNKPETPIPTMKKNIYVSYAWKDREQNVEDSREDIVNKLCDAFEEKGYHVMRDKKDMGYRDVIREFMNDIAGASALIAIVSEKYLKSPYCMYELTAAWDRGDFRNRIFPIILPDGESIFDDIEQINWVAHWENELEKYKNAVEKIKDVTAKEGFLQKLRDREYIYQRVSGAITTVAGMVGLPPQLLLDSNFAEIIKQVENKVGVSTNNNTSVEEKKVENISIKDLLDKGEINKAFEEIEKHEIDDRFLYNRLKKEYIAGGLTGLQLADWTEKMKVFVNKLK